MEFHKHSLSSLGLVFELCTDSVKNYIFKNEKRIPWKTKHAAANTFQWSKQILDALEFIHSKEIVHRDLKLDNVLVSEPVHNDRKCDGLIRIRLVAQVKTYSSLMFGQKSITAGSWRSEMIKITQVSSLKAKIHQPDTHRLILA